MYKESNKQKIIDYLKQGCKGGDLGRVGVEIEHFIIDEDGEAVPYCGVHGRMGVKDILDKLSEFYISEIRTPQGDIMGLVRPNSTVTIEPGSQIEVSIKPYLSISEAEQEYRNFRYRLEQIIAPVEYSIANCGYHPDAKALDLQIIPKDRYRFMDNYMRALPDMHPERMMRTSASVQVSIDFADEEDVVRKMRIAALLAPILAFIADNTGFFEGAANTQPLKRLDVWRHVDPARCGVVPSLFDENFGFEAYVDWMLSTPPIFITHDGDTFTDGMTAQDAYAQIDMTEQDIEHLLSMFWPDVRLKQYIELRMGDSLPPEPAFGYVALIKGLFYGPMTLDILESFLGMDKGASAHCVQDIEDAIAEISEKGHDAVVYGHNINDWIDLLFRLAPEGLGTEFGYLEALKEYKGF